MKLIRPVRGLFLLACVTAMQVSTTRSPAAPYDPADPQYEGRKGVTLYVSKLGDNSDGTSWQKGFHTIQKALFAVPDEMGGHRIVIRPDTYIRIWRTDLHTEVAWPGQGWQALGVNVSREAEYGGVMTGDAGSCYASAEHFDSTTSTFQQTNGILALVAAETTARGGDIYTVAG